MKTTILAAVAVVSFAFAASANAETYSWAFSDTSAVLDGFGTLTTSNALNALGGYDVTSFSGELFSPSVAAVSGLVANPAPPTNATYTYPNNDFWTYNNVLYNPASPHVDNSGILFSAGQLFNIYNAAGVNGQDTLSYHNAGGGFTNINGTFAVTQITSAAPEPGVWALMIAGLAMMGGALRLRRRHVGAVAA